MNLKDFIIVSGHYGCGKTNLSMNLAFDYVKAGEQVTLVDLDIVNPYFRTSNYREELEAAGINIICPNYGATNLDLPSLPAAMYGIFDLSGRVILDVGGDDVGATVLGRFHEKLESKDYDMLYVVNFRRNLTPTADDMIELLDEIQTASRARATCIVNNSHLKEQTTKELILSDREKALEVAEKTGMPLIFTTVPKKLYMNETESFIPKEEYLPVDIYVKTVWETD